MTATAGPNAKGWYIEETDFGGSLVLHRHPDVAVPAYVIEERGRSGVAECSECSELLEFEVVSQ
jgi:hypothetical protein